MRRFVAAAVLAAVSSGLHAQSATLKWLQVEEVKGQLEFVDAQTGKVVNLIEGPVQAAVPPLVPDAGWKGRTLLAKGQMQGGWLAHAHLLGTLAPAEPGIKSLKALKRTNK